MLASVPAAQLAASLPCTRAHGSAAPPNEDGRKHSGEASSAPFTCEVSGQDFAKLIMAGWVPAGLVLGISIGSRHDDRKTARQARWGSGNAEVAGWTELVSQSRHDARGQLERDVTRVGAEGVVIATMQMRVRERDCPVTAGRRDHIVEATLTGTADWLRLDWLRPPPAA